MSERGRSEVKKGSASRIRRGIRSMSTKRMFSGLPKLNRARGKAVKKNRRSKDVKKSKVATREAPPKPCKTLIDLLADNKEFVLWLGEDFASTESISAATLKEILIKIAGFAQDSDDKTTALALINQKPEDDLSNFAAARDTLKTVLGASRFNSLLSQFMSDAYETDSNDDVALKLLRALKPTAIIYGGIDRNIENSLQHDNLSVKSLTSLEVYALQSKNNTSDEEMKQLIVDTHRNSTIVIKPEGDFTKPDSLLFSKIEKFGAYGLTTEGTELESEALDPETKTMKAVLKSFAKDMPIVFLGQDLSKDKDPVAHLLKTFKTEEETPKHVALVQKVIKEDQRFSGEDTGLVYQSYKPHSSGTQIAEFMSEMVGFRTSIPEESPDVDIPFTVAVADNEGAASFVTALADKETIATSISIFANSFDSVPFLLPNDFKELMEKKMKLDREVQDQAESFDNFMAAIDTRTSAFNNKLIPRPSQEEEPKEEEEAEATEETEAKEEEVPEKEIKHPTCIKLLLPTAAGINAGKTGTAHELELLQKLQEIVTDSNGRLEVRFIEGVSTAIAEDFELLYLKNEKADFGDMALYLKEATDDFAVNFYENNTNAAEEKVLLFERMWTQSVSQEESLELIKGYIADVQASIEEAGKKPKKKGMFGRSSKTGSKAKVGSKAQSVKKASKSSANAPKKDRLVTRIVNTVTRKNSKIPKAALEEVAKEVVKEEAKEAAVEEPKEEAVQVEESKEAAAAPADEEPKAEEPKEAAAAETEENKKEEVEEKKEEVEVVEEEKKEESKSKKKKKNNWKLGRSKATKKKKEAPKKEEKKAEEPEKAAEEVKETPKEEEKPANEGTTEKPAEATTA